MWILAALLLIVGVGVFILWPYLRPQPSFADPVVDIDPRLTELYDQRDFLYGAVRDARLDLETGKLSQEDYDQHEAGLKQQAAVVLRSIDEVEQSLSSPQMDAAMEAEIIAVRRAPDRALVGGDDDAVEAAIAVARRRNGGNGAAPAAVRADRFCGHCGGPLKTGDRFCGRCGQALRVG